MPWKSVHINSLTRKGVKNDTCIAPDAKLFANEFGLCRPNIILKNAYSTNNK